MIQTSMSHAIEAAGLPPDAFRDELAVVTGAGQGIGRQTARTLASLGAQVVLAELSAGGAEAAAEIAAAGGRAHFIQTDVSDEASVAALFSELKAFRPVSLLLNNAAYEPVAGVLELPVAAWDRALGVNLRGAFLTCRAVLPAMVAQGRGTIINLVSAEAMPGMAAYIASKQGLVGLTQSLAAEVGEQGIRVVALAPGMVDTPGLRAVAARLAPRLGMTPEQFLAVSLHAAYDGLMPVRHAAAAVAFLAARLAETYHGQVVTGYTVLEQAGLIAPPPIPGTSGPMRRPERHGGAPSTDRAARLRRALDLAQQLQTSLIQTDAEFDRLPIFARPLAHGGFQSKTGRRLQDGLKAVGKLTEQLQRMQSYHAVGDAEYAVDLPRLTDWLTRLAAYYDDVPAQTARFTRDAATLEAVAHQSGERAAVARQLLALATELNG
jgi:NAD(P)-dependent dehydrogenase (short-subunit alcohol dehydrogenase family)